MNYRTPWNESLVSLLGFGLMRLPMTNPETMEIDFPKAEALVDAAYEKGVNYFDTAYGYHNGQSELFAGYALSKYPRKSYNLTSKMPSWMVNTPEDVERVFHEQLTKCRTEYFDFYLVHNVMANKFERIESLKIYEFLQKMKEEGLIRHLGFSFHDTPEVLEAALDRWDWEFVQIQLNYLDWYLQNAERQYELIRDRGLYCIAMEPLRGGSLCDLPPEAEAILRKAHPKRTPAEWGLRFAAMQPSMLTVLSGMNSMAQVEENIQTVNQFQPLSEADLAVLAEVRTAYLGSSPIPCTACRYCDGCPKGVEIPKMLAIINSYKRTGRGFNFLADCNVLGKAKDASNCVACGKCVKVCPQKINIPEEMAKAKEMMETFERPDWLKR